MSVASLVRQGLGSTPSDVVRWGLDSGTPPPATIGPIITLGLKYTPSDVIRLGLGATSGAATYTLTLDHGTVTVLGSDAQRDLSMVLDHGTVALSGQDITLSQATYSLALDPGVVSIGGQAITFLRTYRLVADFGTVNVAGQAATLTLNPVIEEPAVEVPRPSGGGSRRPNWAKPLKGKPSGSDATLARLLAEDEELLRMVRDLYASNAFEPIEA